MWRSPRYGSALGVGLGRTVAVGVAGVAVGVGVTEGVTVAEGVAVDRRRWSWPGRGDTEGAAGRRTVLETLILATTRTRTSAIPDDGGSCQS